MVEPHKVLLLLVAVSVEHPTHSWTTRQNWDRWVNCIKKKGGFSHTPPPSFFVFKKKWRGGKKKLKLYWNNRQSRSLILILVTVNPFLLWLQYPYVMCVWVPFRVLGDYNIRVGWVIQWIYFQNPTWQGFTKNVKRVA